MDRGFLDGADLWVLRHELHIDFVVPAVKPGERIDQESG
jgi:hypothetical protein